MRVQSGYSTTSRLLQGANLSHHSPYKSADNLASNATELADKDVCVHHKRYI